MLSIRVVNDGRGTFPTDGTLYVMIDNENDEIAGLIDALPEPFDDMILSGVTTIHPFTTEGVDVLNTKTKREAALDAGSTFTPFEYDSPQGGITKFYDASDEATQRRILLNVRMCYVTIPAEDAEEFLDSIQYMYPAQTEIPMQKLAELAEMRRENGSGT